jgi:hypothetical protein
MSWINAAELTVVISDLHNVEMFAIVSLVAIRKCIQRDRLENAFLPFGSCKVPMQSRFALKKKKKKKVKTMFDTSLSL